MDADGPVTSAVRLEIGQLASRKPGLDSSAWAAVALELARQLDSQRNSATSKSMVAKQLNDTLSILWGQVPPEQTSDRIDEIAARREARIARRATS